MTHRKRQNYRKRLVAVRDRRRGKQLTTEQMHRRSIVIYKKYIHVVIQMTEIHFSRVFGVHPWFLAPSSPNPWNFLTDKSKECILCYNLWSLALSSCT